MESMTLEQFEQCYNDEAVRLVKEFLGYKGLVGEMSSYSLEPGHPVMVISWDEDRRGVLFEEYRKANGPEVLTSERVPDVSVLIVDEEY